MRLALAAALVSLLATSCDKPKVPTTTPNTNTSPAAPTAPYSPGERRLIDVHTHVTPGGYSLMMQAANRLGVERIFNLSGGSAEPNRASLGPAQRTSGPVLLFHNIDWSRIDEPDFGETEAARLKASYDAGFAGVKVSKALGLGVRLEDGTLLAVDDPLLDAIWAKAGELGMPVAIHTSDPKAFFEPPTPDNERYAELSRAPSWSFYGDEWPSRDELLAARDRMVARHRGTTFILVHLGNNPEDPAYVDALLRDNPNVVLDIAARVGEFGRHDAKTMRSFFERNADRVLFGTDTMVSGLLGPNGQTQIRLTLGSVSDPPATPRDIVPFFEKHFAYFEGHEAEIDHPVPLQGDWKVHPVGLSREVLDKIYFENAERLVAAPWLGRTTAQHVIARASE